MDIRMPHLDGLEATRLICGAEETEDVKVLILTTFDLDEYVYAALRAGASGFLLKDTPPNDLLAGIRVVAAGDGLLAPSVTRQLISEFVRRPDSDRPPPATLDVLTGREREVLTLVARGWSNAEIAERLYLSAATAKTHVGRLLMKLQARDRTQLVVIAYETGLVTPGTPPPRQRPPGAGHTERSHQPRTRSADTGGPGLVQRGDRRTPLPQPRHRQDPRGPPADQAPGARPDPARRHRLRDRARHARRAIHLANHRRSRRTIKQAIRSRVGLARRRCPA